MSKVKTSSGLGSKGFWKIYDQFCSAVELTKLADGEQTETCLELQEILRVGDFVRLPRPEKGWDYPKAWLVLRGENIITDEGHIFLPLQPGDVMTREFGWDRDVLITHTPIIERVSGQFLNQKWHGAQKGLFLPLYTKEVIMVTIQIKCEKNTKNALEKAKEESKVWGWY